MTKQITLIKPDDWHLHFRDGELLNETVPATARCFQRAIVMPNLVPPITTTEQAVAYRERILNARPQGSEFEPLMVLYLTDNIQPDEIIKARQAGVVAAKLYPAGATTNSDTAVTQIGNLNSVFEAMARVDMKLLVHGEVTDQEIDIFDRESVFIERHLSPIVYNFPELKIVMEHITTSDAVKFVSEAADNVAATLTPQHLMLNRNDLLVGGIRPHNYCLPILKRREHQLALRAAVKSGNRRFFLGTDSAPHLKNRKETACGCAGCYSAWSAIELYATVFEEMNILDQLEDFASLRGPDFYDLPRNQQKIMLEKRNWTLPDSISLTDKESIVPFFAGQQLSWKLAKP